MSINKLKRTNNRIVNWYSMTNSNLWGSCKKKLKTHLEFFLIILGIKNIDSG